jgi:hypothetical protein
MAREEEKMQRIQVKFQVNQELVGVGRCAWIQLCRFCRGLPVKIETI